MVMNKRKEMLKREIVKITEKLRNEKKEKINKKERAHKLIVLGTIFEKLNLDNEEREFLLGYLLAIYELSDTEREMYKKIGIEFEKINSNRKEKNE